ncbi:hypothetical protein T265_02743 [Opisthorchis viverrini]|uniref:Uncharacterized protein n=1 Tax=Opisthorchis viverrini TaxID=6198 RepID=A0A075A5M9_OPIVI|nr:hypothetical protein T265_02743 [Opisthorchis viverrini]KER30930.1 hypothetical protein T265_02743 [Opisthorchis viverrini]
MKASKIQLSTMGSSHPPGYQPYNFPHTWLETLQDMAHNRPEWQACCQFLVNRPAEVSPSLCTGLLVFYPVGKEAKQAKQLSHFEQANSKQPLEEVQKSSPPQRLQFLQADHFEPWPPGMLTVELEYA